MSEEKSKVEEGFKFGVAPSLMINIVTDKRAYRFEMPIGAKLDECEKACIECQKVIKKMMEEADAKAKEAEEKKSESSNEEIKKENK